MSAPICRTLLRQRLRKGNAIKYSCTLARKSILYFYFLGGTGVPLGSRTEADGGVGSANERWAISCSTISFAREYFNFDIFLSTKEKELDECNIELQCMQDIIRMQLIDSLAYKINRHFRYNVIPLCKIIAVYVICE